MKSWLAASGAQTEALATSRDRAGRADAPLRRAAGGGAGGRVVAHVGGRRGEPAACGDGAGGAPAGRWDGDVAGADVGWAGHLGYRIGILASSPLGFGGVQPDWFPGVLQVDGVRGGVVGQGGGVAGLGRWMPESGGGTISPWAEITITPKQTEPLLITSLLPVPFCFASIALTPRTSTSLTGSYCCHREY